MRIRCVLWGCWCDRNGGCPKCGSALYDADFIQIGRLAWMQRVGGRLKQLRGFVNRKCEVCGKRYWFTGRNPCCSEKCYDEWIPF
jgi:hypothetical protein